jgi:hypothetical protein
MNAEHYPTNEDAAEGNNKHLRAVDLITHGELQEAEILLAEVLLADPARYIARFQLGLLQVTSGKAHLGVLTWQPLLELSEKNALRWYVAGYIKLISNQFETALDLFTNGLSLHQDNTALELDIRMTISRINETQRTSSRELDKSDENNNAHFLISNYVGFSTKH